MSMGPNRSCKRYSIVCMLIACLLCSGVARASLFGGKKDDPLSKAEENITYLLKMLKDTSMQFDPQKVADLVAFTARPHSNPADIVPASVDGATGGYWEFSLAVPLKDVASYIFNPSVPPEAMYPSNVRLGGWHDEAKARETLQGYWNALPNLSGPLVFHGSEYEETTPDANSGCYYNYDLDRMLILFPQNGTNTLISVSRMQGPSGVGKKGVAVGAPTDWNFFYSGQEGNLLSGLGWADSYLYDSITVYVFQQPDPQKPLTRVSLFKWVNGGWKSINMVKTKHVVKGCQNVANILRQVLQTDSVPSPASIAEEVARIDAVPEAELRANFKPMAELVEQTAAKNKQLARDEFSKVIKGGNYAATLTAEQLRSEYIKDFMRSKILGKSLLQEYASVVSN